jgi:4-alpha-glucanotransferase
MIGSESYDGCASSGLRACGVDKLFLEIHDTSFPSLHEEDTGRGTPYSEAGTPLLEQLAKLGFNGIQLGPQGLTAADNPSPYDGTLFSRNTLSVALSPLRKEGLLDQALKLPAQIEGPSSSKATKGPSSATPSASC